MKDVMEGNEGEPSWALWQTHQVWARLLTAACSPQVWWFWSLHVLNRAEITTCWENSHKFYLMSGWYSCGRFFPQLSVYTVHLRKGGKIQSLGVNVCVCVWVSKHTYTLSVRSRDSQTVPPSPKMIVKSLIWQQTGKFHQTVYIHNFSSCLLS